jgi:ubiquitin-protein ligase
MALREGRIKREIEEIKNIDTEEGLYYFPDDIDLFTGYGLIHGPSDTPYEGGFYVIKFKFPTDYPFKPPTCTHLTMSGVRQSPNFHDDVRSSEGMVCLSRLNTWEGSEPGKDKWTPRLGILYVLHMIQKQVLTNKPLDNEPNYLHSIEHPANAQNYENVVVYHNYSSNVIDLYDKLMDNTTSIPELIALDMADIIFSQVTKDRVNYLEKLQALNSLHNGIFISCTTYSNSSCFCDYEGLIEEFIKRFGNINKIKIKLKKVDQSNDRLEKQDKVA